MPPFRHTKRDYVEHTYVFKLQVLKWIEAGEKLSALGKELNIPPTTLCTWKKKKQHIQENATLSTVWTPHGRRKRSRGSKYPELERALLIWFRNMRSQTPLVKIDHKMAMAHADL